MKKQLLFLLALVFFSAGGWFMGHLLVTCHWLAVVMSLPTVVLLSVWLASKVPV